jgi:hypothetical protein
MKFKYLFMLLLVFQLAKLPAQSSQQGVLLQQIAALRVYGNYVQKGYSAVKKGLNVIGDFKSGEKLLHSDYFQSLGLVNTVFYDGITAVKIISLQKDIIRDADALQRVLESPLFSPDESSYCQRVKSRLLENCVEQIEFLYDLLTDDTLRMDDARRLESIEGIYREMKDNYTFLREFNAETIGMLKQRQSEVSEAMKSKKLFNIN